MGYQDSLVRTPNGELECYDGEVAAITLSALESAQMKASQDLKSEYVSITEHCGTSKVILA